jgi:predicted ester cyclase
MSTTDNKTLARYFRQEMDKGNWAIFDEVVAPDAITHFAGNPEPMNVEGLKQLVQLFYSAFPDLRHTFEDQLAEGDKVVTHITITGTHQGDFQGIPPTGRPVAIKGLVIDRFADGKLAEQWSTVDTMGLLQHLGVIPAPGAA